MILKMANDISPAVVAGGISVALLTTAFGLVVAVILQILQNAVMYIIDNQIVTLQKSTTTLLDAISKKTPPCLESHAGIQNKKSIHHLCLILLFCYLCFF